MYHLLQVLDSMLQCVEALLAIKVVKSYGVHWVEIMI